MVTCMHHFNIMRHLAETGQAMQAWQELDKMTPHVPRTFFVHTDILLWEIMHATPLRSQASSSTNMKHGTWSRGLWPVLTEWTDNEDGESLPCAAILRYLIMWIVTKSAQWKFESPVKTTDCLTTLEVKSVVPYVLMSYSLQNAHKEPLSQKAQLLQSLEVLLVEFRDAFCKSTYNECGISMFNCCMTKLQGN